MKILTTPWRDTQHQQPSNTSRSRSAVLSVTNGAIRTSLLDESECDYSKDQSDDQLEVVFDGILDEALALDFV